MIIVKKGASLHVSLATSSLFHFRYHDLLRTLLVALLYYVAGELSFAVSRENSIVTVVIFFAEGFALGSVLLFGRKMALGVFLGQLFLTQGYMPMIAGVGIATVNALEALLGAYLFDAFGLDRKLSTTKDMFGLVALIVVILQPFSALLGNLILMIFSMVDPLSFWKSCFAWWFGNLVGQILLVPTLLLLYARREDLLLWHLMLVGLFFALISYVLQLFVPLHNVFLLLSITFPLIIYTSSVLGMPYGTFAMVTISVVTLYLSALHLGSFGEGSGIDHLINLNFYFLSQMLLLLTIGTLFEERKRRETELEARILQALKEKEEQRLMLLQQSRLAQMGEAINMIAHQWRQPLNNLLLLCEVLVYRYKHEELSAEIIQKFQRESTLQIQQMSKTIDDFRDFFQPRKAREHFDISRVLEDLMRMVEPIFKMEQIELHCTHPKKTIVDGYPNEFAQAVLNILYNAKDAFVDRSISKKLVKLHLIHVGQWAHLEIWDNAGGIPTEIMGDIFNPYFSTKENLNGTGLGLYMSKMIIQTHMGGKLWVSNHDQGAKFVIELRLV